MHDQLTTVYDDLPADRVQDQTQIEDAKNWASQEAELVASTDRVQDQTHTINDRKDHTQIKDGTNQASNAAELIGDALRESAKRGSRLGASSRRPSAAGSEQEFGEDDEDDELAGLGFGKMSSGGFMKNILNLRRLQGVGRKVAKPVSEAVVPAIKTKAPCVGTKAPGEKKKCDSKSPECLCCSPECR